MAAHSSNAARSARLHALGDPSMTRTNSVERRFQSYSNEAATKHLHDIGISNIVDVRTAVVKKASSGRMRSPARFLDEDFSLPRGARLVYCQ